MVWIIILIFAILLFMSTCFRLAVTHPLLTVKYAFIDLYKFFRYKTWRLSKEADIVCYTGLFGRGKTLTAVHDIINRYYRYNDKKVYDFRRKKWVTQKVHIITNVVLPSVPHELLTSLSQIVDFCDSQSELDEENDTLTLCWTLIDEASSQLNSREFKSNISSEFLGKIVTIRHFHLCIYLTSQRFNLCDKLLRDITQRVVECKKIWRFQTLAVYDAWELENAGNVTMIKPILRRGFFVTNNHFNSYDTHANVEKLSKGCSAGDRLSDEEILALRYAPDNSSIDNVTNVSRSFIRRKKRMMK